MTKRAKQVASLATQAPLLLFVGKKITASAVATASYQKHKCTACNTEVAFAEVPGVTPFCPSCGGTCSPMSGAPVPMAPQEELLTSVGCPHCQTQNVVEDRLLDVLAGVVHCGGCGNGVTYKAVAVAEDDKIGGNDGPAGAETDNNSDEEIRQEAAADGEDGTDGAADGANEGTGLGEPDQNIDDAQGVHQAASDAAIGDDVDEIDVDLPDGLDDNADVEVKLDDDGFGEEAKLLAFVGGVHAYTLVKANAGDNADLMTQPSFHQALQRETASGGHKVLAGYGFSPVTVKVRIGRIVEKRVQAALTTEQAKVVASLTDVRDNFEQCAKIASAALTQNFFRHRTNPLQDQLVAALTGMGVKQAKTVVNRAMLNAGPAFVTAMLELADELLDKSVEHRNELSDSLTQMSPEAINADAQEDVDGPEADDELRTSPEEITARLQSPVEATTRHRQQASAQDFSSAAQRLRQLKNL